MAKDIEELRVLNVYIEGIKIKALADDGSQIINIRKDLWKKFRAHMRLDQRMRIESANKSKDKTIGLLQDLKISMGGYDFYVQVQVVQDRPYELLLGQPFSMLTQATHCHFSNGDSHLTLVDPNMHTVITIIPTCPCR